MERSAYFSECRKFRYILYRKWDKDAPIVLFIGLNPSKADGKIDDPTIRRCISFSKGWGFGGFAIVNLFAYCSHNPNELFKINDPIGPKNDSVIIEHIPKAEKIILIWGNHGSFLKRNEKILKLIKKPFCLKINKNGSPAHPLYLKSTLKPIPYIIQ